MKAGSRNEWPGVLCGVLAWVLSACGPGEPGSVAPGSGDDGVAPAFAPLGGGSAQTARDLPTLWQPEQLVAQPPPRSVPRLERSTVAPPWEWKPETRTVALEGEEAPGTGGARFVAGSWRQASVNEPGDAAFVAGYAPPSPNSPSGLFFFDHDDGKLAPVILVGQQIDGVPVLELVTSPSLSIAQINDRREIADIVYLDTTTTEPFPINTPQALVQAHPTDERCERFEVRMIAETGMPAPGGGFFTHFFNVEENERGDLAFSAQYQFAPGDPQTGVFLYKAREHELVAVVREHDELPGTGGFFCTSFDIFAGPVRGPWLNGGRTVGFQANCIGDPRNPPRELTALEDSVFLWTEEDGIRPFVLRGSPGPRRDGCDACTAHDSERPVISDTDTWHPGLAEDRMVFRLELFDGVHIYPVIATKLLSESADEHRFEVCATAGDEVGRGDTLEDFGQPTIGDHGLVSIDTGVETWVDGARVEQEALFSCFDRHLAQIVRTGDRMPVGKDNRFDDPGMWSSSDRKIIFEDNGPPSGLWISNTNPQLP